MNDETLAQESAERTVPVTPRYATCPNCGELLDAFGCCPHTNQRDIERGVRTCGGER